MSETQRQSVDPAWWDAWRGVLFANSKVIHQADIDLQEHSGISLTTIDVLARLYDAPGRKLRMQELQERSLFTTSGMTRLVDRLEAENLVTREHVPGDRRGIYVVLTDHGMSVYEKAIVRHRADIEREFASFLSPKQQAAVAEALWSFWHE